MSGRTPENGTPSSPLSQEGGSHSKTTREYLFNVQTAVWIDDLAKLFGKPFTAEAPPSRGSRLADEPSYATEEVAGYSWDDDGGNYTLMVSRSGETTDPYFHVSLEFEKQGEIKHFPYRHDIAGMQIDLKQKRVAFFTARRNDETVLPALVVFASGKPVLG